MQKERVTVAKALFTISFFIMHISVYEFSVFTRFFSLHLQMPLVSYSICGSLSEVNVFISHSVKRNAISQRFLNHLTRYSCIFCKNEYNNSACCFHVLLERNTKHDLFMIHSQRENVRIKKNDTEMKIFVDYFLFFFTHKQSDERFFFVLFLLSI